jgi:hypothetical protein
MTGKFNHKHFMIFCKRGNLYPAGYRGRRRLLRVGREGSGLTLRQTSSQILITTATEKKNEERGLGAAALDRIPVYPGQRPLFLQQY